MNLPNKLTLLRIVLIAPFLLVLYLDVPGAAYIALAIFILASLTDPAPLTSGQRTIRSAPSRSCSSRASRTSGMGVSSSGAEAHGAALWRPAF